MLRMLRRDQRLVAELFSPKLLNPGVILPRLSVIFTPCKLSHKQEISDDGTSELLIVKLSPPVQNLGVHVLDTNYISIKQPCI